MAYEVVVIGAGIGGLTTAALLAARGVKVCLLERMGHVGGCASSFQKLGFTFEQGASVYHSWGKGEIHERIFSELPLSPPEVRQFSPSYVVRLPDHSEISVTGKDEEYETNLRKAFPECADAAIRFFRELAATGAALHDTLGFSVGLPASNQFDKSRRWFEGSADTVGRRLYGCSTRFHRFIDVQLQMFAQADVAECDYAYAAMALTLQRRAAYEIKGGSSSLADALAESLKKSGGTLRLNSTVLRISYGTGGRTTGVDLLNGERIEASRAVISNLTIWDTYGKLVGINRAPSEVRGELRRLRGRGAYLIYLSIEEESARLLPARHILAVTDWQEKDDSGPEQSQLMFTCAPSWDTRGSSDKRAVTICTLADVEPWFSFHEDESQFEEMDQSNLEAWWQRLHTAMPELGGSVEVIDTATPRTFYESTRRKLGMVGGISQSMGSFISNSRSHRTSISNLYMVGDCVFPGQGIDAVSLSGLIVSDELSPRAIS